jgi:ribosome-binding protein aMBF1 (putative translation factor)
MIHECDLCGRQCTRLHHFEAYGLEGRACDDCANYEWEAYDEPADPLLYPEEANDD